ncbi:chemotaxis protein CheW [Solidesulfovibrio sp.]|uniref:chemotaxis protein CheW n=1 Tax=Solidesulfovibrio sp. TaxID=2910990 RepID=UPI0026211D61|nr:chemotaxis protein CheW [Solidesulfovibrio sp.]
MEEKAVSGVRRVLTLTLGETGCFAIDIFVVREILDFTEITRLPRMPEHMRGVVDVRGQAVPVVDLGVKLGFGPVEQTIHTRIVIVEQTDEQGQVRLIGALTEAVKEVLELDEAGIAPPPSMGMEVENSCIQGISHHDGRFIVLLDTARVFDTDEVQGLAGLVERAAADTQRDAA